MHFIKIYRTFFFRFVKQSTLFQTLQRVIPPRVDSLGLYKYVQVIVKVQLTFFGILNSFEGPGELAASLDDFDASLIINPLTYDEGRHRKTLEESLESIISGAALLADSRYGVSKI